MSMIAELIRPFDQVALNPQPLPPGDFGLSLDIRSKVEAISLNPQPLPPKDLGLELDLSSRIDAAALNPQPLPPKDLSAVLIAATDTDDAALNPQPIPPGYAEEAPQIHGIFEVERPILPTHGDPPPDAIEAELSACCRFSPMAIPARSTRSRYHRVLTRTHLVSTA